ncbi:hypothetical protein HU200_061859 [Digitaria exilis]|uniref:Uncharacterized protein n=1 Tax=Digitaria exilis TaxID=1010633 RepID=A0A835ADN5_9POAL|nr:hypothetical protein HU200_061859 [Digitaria exilis]
MMLRRVASSTPPVPEWLEALLATRFFLACAAHPASPRNECNMFCLDCTRGSPPPPPPPAFCYYCRAHRHATHRVIQIRRSSYHDVVRVSEVEDVLDITGVQTYVINSARVLFLNERPQPRGAGAAAGKAAASPYNCEICGRALLDPFRFCSLGCKVGAFLFLAFFLIAPPAHPPTCIIIPPKNTKRLRLSVTVVLVDTKRSNGGHAAAAGDADGGAGIEKADAGGSKNDAARPLGRRRKGIPHRAPFWS